MVGGILQESSRVRISGEEFFHDFLICLSARATTGTGTVSYEYYGANQSCMATGTVPYRTLP